MNYFLNLYSSFSCLAGSCPFTCCSGWSIEISEKDYLRFENLEPEWLQERILSDVERKGERYFFKNRENGDCAMLLDDGLCCIQKHTSEKTLCNTCRKFPRIYGGTEEIRAFSMAASCPVTAQAVLEDRLFLYQETAEGLLKIPFDGFFHCQNMIAFWEERQGKKSTGTEQKASMISGIYENLTEHLLDLVLSFRTFLKADILELFSYYETDRTEEQMEQELLFFEKIQKTKYGVIKKAYVPYRIFGAWLENPEEPVRDLYVKLCGELFLFFYFGFLFFQKNGSGHSFSDEDWIRVICLTYRLMVHEKKLGEGLFCFFEENLEQVEQALQWLVQFPAP